MKIVDICKLNENDKQKDNELNMWTKLNAKIINQLI